MYYYILSDTRNVVAMAINDKFEYFAYRDSWKHPTQLCVLLSAGNPRKRFSGAYNAQNALWPRKWPQVQFCVSWIEDDSLSRWKSDNSLRDISTSMRAVRLILTTLLSLHFSFFLKKKNSIWAHYSSKLWELRLVGRPVSEHSHPQLSCGGIKGYASSWSRCW